MDKERDNWNNEEAGGQAGSDAPLGEEHQTQNQTGGDGLWTQAGKRPQEPEPWEQAGSRRWTGGGESRNQTDKGPGLPYGGQTPPPPYTEPQQNRKNDDKQYGMQYQIEYKKKSTDGMGIASLVLGIMSIVICCCSWIGIVFGVLGILFAMMAKGEEPLRESAKVGFIISIVGVALNVVLIILYIVFQGVLLLPYLLSY